MAKLLTYYFQSTCTYILSYMEIKVVGFYFKNKELIKNMKYVWARRWFKVNFRYTVKIKCTNANVKALFTCEHMFNSLLITL